MALQHQPSLFGSSLTNSEKRLMDIMAKRGITLPDDASESARQYYVSVTKTV